MILFVTNDVKGSIIYVGKDNLIVFFLNDRGDDIYVRYENFK